MNKEKVYIGCDPGKDGAIVILHENKEVDIFLIKNFLIKEEYDLSAISDLFESFIQYDCHIAIEDVASMFEMSAKSNWTFSRGKAILECFSTAYSLPFTLVHSKSWQKNIFEGTHLKTDTVQKFKKDKITGKKIPDGFKEKTDTKSTALLVAKRLFPNVNFIPTKRSRNEHYGIIDALLMAEYLRRTNK